MSFYSDHPVAFGSVSMVTATLGPNDPELGTVRWQGNEAYILVYNGSATDIAPGLAATVTGVSGYTVTVSTVTDIDIPVGVCKHATLTSSTYGWLMIRGFAPIQASAAIAISPPNRVICGTNGFFTNVIASVATTSPYGVVVGKCVASAASASTTGMAYFSLL